MVLGFLFSRAVSVALGTTYPAYASYKAIRSNDPALHRQWLMYWIVLAAFNVFEFFGDSLIFWLPCYYESKILFIIWLIFPGKNGATILYENYLSKFLETHEEDIDEFMREGVDRTKHHVKRLSTQGLEVLSRHGSQALLKAHEALNEMAKSDNKTIAEGSEESTSVSANDSTSKKEN